MCQCSWAAGGCAKPVPFFEGAPFHFASRPACPSTRQTLDGLGATIFFQLVSARYERGSIILTSNKSYGEWGSIFGDTIIATAILDRLLHHSTTVNIRGESYRLKERRKAGLIPLPEQHQADISAGAPSGRGRQKQSL